MGQEAETLHMALRAPRQTCTAKCVWSNEPGFSGRVLTNVKNALDDEAPDFEEFSDAANFVSPRVRSSAETLPGTKRGNARGDSVQDETVSVPMATSEAEVQSLRGRRRSYRRRIA